MTWRKCELQQSFWLFQAESIIIWEHMRRRIRFLSGHLTQQIDFTLIRNETRFVFVKSCNMINKNLFSAMKQFKISWIMIFEKFKDSLLGFVFIRMYDVICKNLNLFHILVFVTWQRDLTGLRLKAIIFICGLSSGRSLITFRNLRFIPSKREKLYNKTDSSANYGGLVDYFTETIIAQLIPNILLLTIRLGCALRGRNSIKSSIAVVLCTLLEMYTSWSGA